LNILKSLDALGHDVVFFPRVVWRTTDLAPDLSDVALILRCMRRHHDIDMAAPCLRISPEAEMTLFAGRGPRCGLSFFETTRFTDRELRHLGSVDLLFVASEWARSVAIDNGLAAAAVFVAPMGVDREVFHETAPRKDGPTVFVNVGAWQYRKGHDLLLEAFGRAFRPGDDVELRLQCHNPWSSIDDERWLQCCRESPMAGHITVLPRTARHREIADVLRDADCGVFPSRGEAWNLEALEMLSCGRHVIATRYAGHTEYLDPGNASLIEIDELEPVDDPIWMPVFSEHKVGDWARLGDHQLEQLVQHLRAVHERKQSGALGLNCAGVATAERFTWAHTARRLVAGFESFGGAE
jgi:glycosyltransferase involved in cell wall biosynthesis